MVELADVRILALGVLHDPPSPIYVNTNAQVLLRPPETDFGDSILPMDTGMDNSVLFVIVAEVFLTARGAGDPLRVKLRPMSHPLPTPPFRNYPLFTPGREDRRWLGPGGLPNDKAWLGGLMYVVPLTSLHPLI